MSFTDFSFYLIFPVVFIVYWSIPSKFHTARNVFLLIISYLFYMNWNPAFSLVLLFVTLITFWGGLHKRRLLSIVALALIPLLTYKYYDFFNYNITWLLCELGVRFKFSGLNWAIPIGISFYTFQAVGYLLDVYRGRVVAEKNFADYALFVSFFPQILSGPISTAKELLPQIKSARIFKYQQGKEGLKLLLWGLFLKLVIADRIGLYVDTVYPNYSFYSGANCLFASVLYTIQIYCDFAGYSLMAIGIAKTLGFDLVNNFRRPYFASSVTEFWKRWHISLTRWLTTHVYIELGGNRCSKARQYFNIMITFLVSGLWHGANWTFVIWGGIHGLFQIIEKYFFGERLKSELKETKRHMSFVRFIRVCFTFTIVSFAWIFFRMPSFSDAISFISKIFLYFGSFSLSPLDNTSAVVLVIALSILLLREIREEYCPAKLKVLNRPVTKWFFYLGITCFLLLMGVLDGGQFIYVSF